jgi:hypothetical protein
MDLAKRRRLVEYQQAYEDIEICEELDLDGLTSSEI